MRIARSAVVITGLFAQGCSLTVGPTDSGGAGGGGETASASASVGSGEPSSGTGDDDGWFPEGGVSGTSVPKGCVLPVDVIDRVSTTIASPDFSVAQFAIARLRAGQLPNPIELPTAPFLEYFRSLVPASADATQTSVTAEYSFLESSTPAVGLVDLTVRAPAILTPRKDGHFVFAVTLTPGMPGRGPVVRELVARGVAALVERGFVGHFSVVVLGAEMVEVIPSTPIEAGLPTDLLTRLDAKLAIDALSGIGPVDAGLSTLDTLWLKVKELESASTFVPAYREYVLFVAGDAQSADELGSSIESYRNDEALLEVDTRLHAVQVAPSPNASTDDPLSVHRPFLTARLSHAGDGYGIYVDDALLDTANAQDFAVSQAEFAVFMPAIRGVRLSLVAPPIAWFDLSDSGYGGDVVALSGTLEAGATVRRSVRMAACSSAVTGGEGTLQTNDPTVGAAYDADVTFAASEPVEQAREQAVTSVVFALRGTQGDFCTRFSLAQSLIEQYEVASSPDAMTFCAAAPAALDACNGVVPNDGFAAACCLGARLRGVLELADALVELPCTP